MGKARAAAEQPEVDEKGETGQGEPVLVMLRKEPCRRQRARSPGLVDGNRLPLVIDRQYAPQLDRHRDFIGGKPEGGCRADEASDFEIRRKRLGASIVQQSAVAASVVRRGPIVVA